jgi:hypothetical protein
MKTRMSFRPVLLAAALLVYINSEAQVSVPQNSPSNPGVDYVGWDNNTGVPLEIRHNANQRIEWYTDAVRRMTLRETDQNASFNTYNQLDLSGHLALGENHGFPLTLLHLKRGNSIGSAGYRPWMKTGVMTSDSAWAMTYLGMRRFEQGPRSAILAWSQRIGAGFPSEFSFTFTSDPQNPVGQAGTMNGLEIARMLPDPNGNEGYFGLGDFQAAVAQPTERLDVLNGNVRVRDLPSTTSTSLNFVTVDMNTGLLQQRTLPTPPVSCEWSMTNPGITGPAVAHHVYTAVDTDDACPDNQDAVGIGVNLAATQPIAKLHLRNTSFSAPLGADPSVNTGMRVEASGNQAFNMGVSVNVSGATAKNRGVQAVTSGGTLIAYAGDFVCNDATNGVGSESFGVQGYVRAGNQLTIGVSGRSSTNALTSIGVRGISHVSSTQGSLHYGVWGQAGVTPDRAQTAYAIYGECFDGAGKGTTDNSWAGYFAGDVNVTGDCWNTTGNWNPSDEQFKTNINEIEAAATLLAMLHPKTYEFSTQAHPHLQFPIGQQYGLIAQELQSVLPSLVKSNKAPAVFDTLGTLIHDEVEYIGVNYTGLIPILIAGHKEQQAVIEEQRSLLEEQQAQIAALAQQVVTTPLAADELQELRSRLDQLEQLLALCCQSAPVDQRSLQNVDEPLNGLDQRTLRIQPNPFSEQTSIYYQLERSGRMQLMANSSDGKLLRVLEEAQREAGEYRYEWITADLAPGIYYVTLLLDGEPVVKKAVKVR